MSDYMKEMKGKQTVNTLKELKKVISLKNENVYELQPNKLRDALIGKPLDGDAKELGIDIIQLKNANEKQFDLYSKVFRNLIHMKDLNMENIKRQLIKVLVPGRHTSTSSHEFMARYRKIREDAEKAKSRYMIAKEIKEHVIQLNRNKELALDALSRLHALSPLIEVDYANSNEMYEKVISDIKKQETQIEEMLKSLEENEKDLHRKDLSNAVEISQVKGWLKELEDNKKKFSLISSVDQIQDHIDSLSSNISVLTSRIGKKRNINDIQRDLSNVKQKVKEYHSRYDMVDNNLLVHLLDNYNEFQLQNLSRILNHHLLSALPMNDEGILITDVKHYRDWLDVLLGYVKQDKYDDGSIRINLGKVQPINLEDYFDREHIEGLLRSSREHLEELQKELDVARDINKYQRELNKAQKDLESEYKYKSDYQDYVKCLAEETIWKTREEQVLAIKTELDVQLAEVKSSINNEQGKKIEIAKKLQSAEEDQIQIRKLYDSMQTESLPVGDDRQARHLPQGLLQRLESYHQYYQEYTKANENILKEIMKVENYGGTVFMKSDDTFQRIDELVDVIESTDRLREAWEKEEKGTIVEAGAMLDELVKSLDTFKTELRKFVNEIKKRKISNIADIELTVDDSGEITKAIRTLVLRDDLYADVQELDRAVDKLNDLIEQKGIELALHNLFTLSMCVELDNGHTACSTGMSRMESTGTGIMLQVIINLMILMRLTVSKPGEEFFVPVYIDEAAQIDPANQQTLINQCKDAGFVPVFASVTAQGSATYCVGLYESSERLYIDEEHWVALEYKVAS